MGVAASTHAPPLCTLESTLCACSNQFPALYLNAVKILHIKDTICWVKTCMEMEQFRYFKILLLVFKTRFVCRLLFTTNAGNNEVELHQVLKKSVLLIIYVS